MLSRAQAEVAELCRPKFGEVERGAVITNDCSDGTAFDDQAAGGAGSVRGRRVSGS